MKSITVFAISALTAMLLTSCGGEGTVKLQLKNGTSGHALVSHNTGSVRAATLSKFGMKLIAAYLSEDITPGTNDNIGKTAMFYLNPQCNDDISNCNVGGSATHVVTNFFDFLSPTDVNTELNAQGRAVETGTYKYARLEFCKATTGGVDNVQWEATGTGLQGFENGACAISSDPFDPPLEVGSGDTVTVTLTYDLSAAITEGTGVGGDCYDPDGANICFNVPTFKPSASK